MRVLHFVASAGSTSDRCSISQPTQELLVRITGPAAALGANPLLSRNEIIFTSINSKVGTEVPGIPNVGLGALGFFAQHGEGAIEKYDITVNAVSKSVIEMTIKLAPALAVRLSAEEALELSISNCVPDTTYEVFAQPAKAQGTNILKYHKKSVNEGTTESTFGASNLVGLILPNSAPLQEVIATLSNGQTEKRTPTEIANQNATQNDIAIVADGKVITSRGSGYLWFDLADAVSVEVKTTGSVYQFVTVEVAARG